MGLTRKASYSLWHSDWNCDVGFGTQRRVQPQAHLAVNRRTLLAIERAGQAGPRCRSRCAVDCQIEDGVEVLTYGGADFPSPGAIGRRIEPRTRRATDRRAKSLIDGDIDVRSERGLDARPGPQESFTMSPFLPRTSSRRTTTS